MPKNAKLPAWKTRWPRNNDLKAWMLCMLEKCEEAGSEDASLAISQLAEMGETKLALKHVDRELRKLSSSKDSLPIVVAAEQGAEICLTAGDLRRMERYLQHMAASEPLNTRKRDKGFSLSAVRKFKALNGLLDPAEAADDEERIDALHFGALRRFEAALTAKRKAAAIAALRELEAVVPQIEKKWDREPVYRDIVKGYARLKDSAGVQRWIKKMPAEDREEVLDMRTLWELGLRPQAMARAKREITNALEELAEGEDSNAHWPAMHIEWALEFLHKHGEPKLAKTWLRRVLREAKSWSPGTPGFTTAALYRSLAKVTGLIDEPQAAQKLLELGMGDAKAERRVNWRHGAVAENLELQSELGQIDEAIAMARKLRSPRERRKNLAVLLAKAGRWKELREVLQTAGTPKEAAELCWDVKFELPGGKV